MTRTNRKYVVFSAVHRSLLLKKAAFQFKQEILLLLEISSSFVWFKCINSKGCIVKLYETFTVVKSR